MANVQRLSGNTLATEGVFLSGIYDAGRVVSWDSLRWTEELPAGCDVELEVCVADDFAEFEDYGSPPAWFGPTGGGNFTTPAGQDLPSGKTGRYAMVRATLTGNGSATPTLSDIQLTCNAGSDTGSRVIRYRYDNAGNITRITTVADSGVTHDIRDSESWAPEDRVNDLNQIMRQDTGAENWRFTWDDNGNLTQKSCGAETFNYVWNEDNRLIQVTKEVTVGGWGAARYHDGTFHQTPSTAVAWVVDYTYDSAGRMLTRDDNDGNVTTFLWDGWQMIRETTGESVTTYCIPEGQLLSFIRDGERFDCHTDALGSVRLVTNDEGNVVSRFDHGAYGELLAGSFDGVPGGMPYTWVGALGVRRDELTGMYYMRQRWYDPSCQRFISRDPLGIQGGSNAYRYCNSAPVDYVDPSGLTWAHVALFAAWALGEGIRYLSGARDEQIRQARIKVFVNGRYRDKGCVIEEFPLVLGGLFGGLTLYGALRNSNLLGLSDPPKTGTMVMTEFPLETTQRLQGLLAKNGINPEVHLMEVKFPNPKTQAAMFRTAEGELYLHPDTGLPVVGLSERMAAASDRAVTAANSHECQHITDFQAGMSLDTWIAEYRAYAKQYYTCWYVAHRRSAVTPRQRGRRANGL